MKHFLKSLAAGFLISIATLSASFADALNVDADGLAVQGYDVVAYFTENSPVKGDEAFSATHDGGIYHFSSMENRDAFAADPEKFVPAYGGFCAYGVTQDAQIPIQPDKFKIVDGTLYLNVNARVQSIWEKDIPKYISIADEKWPVVGADG